MSSVQKLRFEDLSLSSIHSDNMAEGRRSYKSDKNSDKTLPFVEEDSLSDVVLLVEGRRLFTSRALLSMSSPVLNRMLQSPDYKEKSEISLEGKCYDHILELLYILHPAYQRKLTDHSIFLILSLAEEYQIWNLKQKCEETLLSYLNNEKQVPEDLLLKCLHVSDQYKLFALWTKCLQICSRPSLTLSSLQHNREYEKLSRFLKSMLEAFKGVQREESNSKGRDEVPKGRDEMHRGRDEVMKGPDVRLSSHRRDNVVLVNDTNTRKAYTTIFTQTRE